MEGLGSQRLPVNLTSPANIIYALDKAQGLVTIHLEMLSLSMHFPRTIFPGDLVSQSR
jgi:hypothetical protein